MTDQKRPEPCVGALIFYDNKALFVKSHKWKGKYTISGGHIELGETLESALKREVREETGLEIYKLRFISFQEFIYDDAFWKRKHYIFFDFACEAKSNNVNLNSEGQEYKWAYLSDALKNMDIEPYTKRTIEHYIDKFQE